MTTTDVETSRFYGKYRGTVLNNVDPLQSGRVLVQVPDVLGMMPSSWAMPCLPMTGPQAGTFWVPPIGAGVWVEFEQGDPGRPIWVGGFYGSGAEVPALARTAPPPVEAFTLQTMLQNGLLVSDNPASTILLKTATGAMILVNEAGITISNGRGASIVLAGNAVTVNGGALVVL